MTGFLDAWDAGEQWLVAAPFAVQVLLMTAVGIPSAWCVAQVVHAAADLLVRWARAVVHTPQAPAPEHRRRP